MQADARGSSQRRRVSAAEGQTGKHHDASKTIHKCTRRARRLTSDAHWLNRSLWTGLVPHYGPVWTTLLGSPKELAEAFLAYKQIGVTEFIISGWPEVDEVDNFGREVLPLVREAERQRRRIMYRLSRATCIARSRRDLRE